MYMASDLERLGDYGNSISKTAIGLADEEYIKPLIDIPRMFDIVEAMLEKSLEAFEKNSKDLAIEVFALDDQVDDLETQILRELVFLMIEKTSRIEQGSKLFLVARNLERAGDHVTNIAERVLYILTGEYVSASKYRRPEKSRSEGF
jgi:phosphate transport system protein